MSRQCDHQTGPNAGRRLSAASAAFFFLATGLSAPLAHAEPPHCIGLILDRSEEQDLVLISRDRSVRDVTLTGTSKAKSLNQLVVYDCDMDFYTVKYQEKFYLVDRLQVIDGSYIVCPHKASNQVSDRKTRSVDGQGRGAMNAFPNCPTA
jgi:hypothetical protein